MSIENELKRIADSLERYVSRFTGVNPPSTPPPQPVTTGAPDMLPAATAKKGKKSTVAPAAQPAVKPEISKQDITTVLQAFLKKNPGPEGADKARVFFTNAGAKNITTLHPDKYKEVFLGLSEAVK